MQARLKLASVLAVVLMLSQSAQSALAASPIVLDGQFGDWAGRENVSDKSGESNQGTDIHYFYWGTIDNDNNLYFMIQRYADSGSGNNVSYKIYVDTNNDGSFGSDVDRVVSIDYNPNQNNSNVQVGVSKPSGQSTSSNSGDWGDSIREGGLRVEARASFAALGISARQTIRMYAAVENRDRVPDTGDIQFSPIPILDYPLLSLVVVGAIGFVWWKRGRFAWKGA